MRPVRFFDRTYSPQPTRFTVAQDEIRIKDAGHFSAEALAKIAVELDERIDSPVTLRAAASPNPGFERININLHTATRSSHRPRKASMKFDRDGNLLGHWEFTGEDGIAKAVFLVDQS